MKASVNTMFRKNIIYVIAFEFLSFIPQFFNFAINISPTTHDIQYILF